MKSWVVTYRDKDGDIRQLTVNAETRSAVFAQLDAKGISAIRVSEGGAKAGPLKQTKPLNLLKYCTLIVAIIVVLIGFIAIYNSESAPNNTPKLPPPKTKDSTSKKAEVPLIGSKEASEGVLTRSQSIASTRTQENVSAPNCQTNKVSYGPDDMINQALAQGRRQIFRHQSDIWFSHFIVPGVRVPPIPLNVSLKDSFIASLTDPIEYTEDDTEKEREIKEEVSNMRKQASEWIKNGGTFEDFMKELETRQQKEADRVEVAREVLLNHFKEDGDPQSTIELWRALNAKMEGDGLRPMSLPAPIKIQMVKQGIKIQE